MNPTAFRNIHVAQQVDRGSQPSTLNSQPAAPRRRPLTNDPAREYAQRPGEVDRLPDSVAALILSKQGYSKVQRNGIVVEGVTAKPLKFWSENSITIAEKAGTTEKVLWTLNRQQPDVLHILTPDGEYVESIPLDGKAAWFDQAAMARELGAKTRAQNAMIDRVRALHTPDAEEAIDRADHNVTQLKGVVQTFPADRQDSRPRATASCERGTGQDRIATQRGGDISSVAATATRPRFNRAERLREVQLQLERSRNGHETRRRAIADAQFTEDELAGALANDAIPPHRRPEEFSSDDISELFAADASQPEGEPAWH